ncbi:MAG: hypothetical protein FWF03_00345, partial [Defluviitaleaceae bacterium]|nr:hypothetical protein [Defluviitaleaceae bacterium]
MFLASGCGAPKGPVDEGNGSFEPGLDASSGQNHSGGGSADLDNVNNEYADIASGDYDYTSEFLTIVWGLHWLNPNRAVIYPAK